MTGLSVSNLVGLLKPEWENVLKAVLDEFSCPLNEDVEDFLKHKAVEFAKQRFAATYIVTKKCEGASAVVGYSSIAQKFFQLGAEKHDKLSNKLRRRVNAFGEYEPTLGSYLVSAMLIGQLGKNYANQHNERVTGAELLQTACDTVVGVQQVSSGRLVYAECEDNPSLVDFYVKNGFVAFGERRLDRDETDGMSNKYLVQLMKSL